MEAVDLHLQTIQRLSEQNALLRRDRDYFLRKARSLGYDPEKDPTVNPNAPKPEGKAPAPPKDEAPLADPE